jgi:outer membrane protein, adhesin transport system
VTPVAVSRFDLSVNDQRLLMSPSRLSIVLVLGLGVLLSCPLANAETIASVVERVIRSNPTVGAAYFNSKSRLGAIGVAKAQQRPKLSVSAQTGRNKNRGSSDSVAHAADLQVVQRLYDGGEASSQVRRTQAELFAAKGRYLDAILVNSLLVIQTYIEVQRSRQILEIAEKNLASLRQLQDIVRQRTTAGFASEAELYHAISTVASAREQFFAARQQRDDAASDYASLTGSPPGVLESVGSPNSAIPLSADESVRLALKHSPRIMALGYDAVAAYASYAVAKSATSPKVNLNMRVNYNSSSGGVDYEEISSSAAVVIKFDLYDGGEKKARQQQAAFLAQETQQNTRREKMTTERDVRRTWNAVLTTHDKLTTLSQRITAARQAYRLNLQRFKAGKSDISVLLNLQAELASSQNDRVNELATGRYNTYRILAATGRLLMALNLSTSQLGFVE